MDATLENADLTYETVFSAPLFDLSSHQAKLLKSLYENIEPVCHIEAGDIQVLSGASLADNGIRIDLFDGMASIKITTEKLSITFDGLQKKEDIEICRKCTIHTENAISRVLPGFQEMFTTIQLILSMRLEEGKNAGHYITQIARPGIPFDMGKFSKADQYFDLGFDLDDATEKWDASISCWRDESSSFTFRSYVNFLNNGTMNTAEEKFRHVEGLIAKFFSVMKLNVSKPVWGEYQC